MQVGVLVRGVRSPTRRRMHAGYVVLRVPCGQRVLNLTQGALLLRCASLRSFSVRSLHTPVVMLAKASRYHCEDLTRYSSRMAVENTLTEMQIIICARAAVI